MKIKRIGLLLGLLAVVHSCVLGSVSAQGLTLSLQASVQQALAHSPALKTAQAEAEKAGWLITEHQANQLPFVSANYTESQSRPVGEGLSNPNRSSSLEAKTTLYSGGLNEGMVAQAKAAAAAATAHRQYVAQQVITETYLAYYTVLQAQQGIELAEEAVTRLSQHMAVVQAQYEEGTAIKSDVLRTEVELAQAKQNHSKAQNFYKLKHSQLLTLLGLAMDTELVLQDKEPVKAYEGSVQAAVARAFLYRLDLQEQQQNQKAAQYGVAIAQSGYLPTVSLSVKKDWQNQKGTADPLTAQVGVSFTVFDGQRTKAKIKQAEWESRKGEERLQAIKEQITTETQEAYFNQQDAYTALAIASQVVSKAQEDYEIAQVRYQAGLGTNLDVIDSQGALTSAQRNYTNARYDYNKYSIQLAKAMGTIEEDIYVQKETVH